MHGVYDLDLRVKIAEQSNVVAVYFIAVGQKVERFARSTGFNV